jgi:hypothetical protein
MKPRLRAVLWFLFSLVILGFSATPGYKTLDNLLSVGTVTTLLALSALKVWQAWKTNLDKGESKGMSGQLFLFLRSWQRWLLDEHDDHEKGKTQSKAVSS